MVFQAFQPIAAIATTPTAVRLLQPFMQSSGAALWVPQSLLDDFTLHSSLSTLNSYTGSLKDHLESIWQSHRCFVFCLATGAVTRLIAPLLRDKATDPAVVVVDESGQFVISLCGGHQGGADQLTRLIALQISATPVLTGASHRAELPGIDVLGIPFGWRKGAGDWTGVSAAIARNEPVQVIQEVGSTLWQKNLPEQHPFVWESGARRQEPEGGEGDGEDGGLGGEESGAKVTGSTGEARDSDFRRSQESGGSERFKAQIWITHRHPTPNTYPLTPNTYPLIHWHPRVLWIGIGCERGTSKKLIEHAVQLVLQANHLAEDAIAGITTIDLKADEVGLVEFCRDRDLPLCCFAAEVLNQIQVPNPSKVVEAEVGTASVAEAAAIVGGRGSGVGGRGQEKNGARSQKPEARSGKFSLEATTLIVPKQVVRLEGEPGAVTIAVAQAEWEYTGRTGQLWLVGTGPGQLDQITPAAQTAIAQADVVIGYSLYIDLVRSLLHPGQIVEASPITQERQRAERAIDLAQWGLTVAVISSGDCGIYGMAGLVLEQLSAAGWDGKTPSVRVFPGITALQSAASLVGAPLMHDFCVISLSDLLTPWEMIEKRLTAAAQADFVVALYNPKSQTRTEQIVTAQKIFLQYRDSDTPVAIVRSAYRPDEQVTVTTLAKFLSFPVDMLTTILIGNQSSRVHANWFVTPRGYLGFGAE